MDGNIRNHLSFLFKSWNIQEKVNRLYIWQHSSVLSRQNNLCKVDVLPTFYQRSTNVLPMFYWCNSDVLSMYNGMLYFGLIDEWISKSDNFLPVSQNVLTQLIIYLQGQCSLRPCSSRSYRVSSFEFVITKLCWFFLIFHSLVPKSEICSKYFLHKKIQKRPQWFVMQFFPPPPFFRSKKRRVLQKCVNNNS